MASFRIYCKDIGVMVTKHLDQQHSASRQRGLHLRAKPNQPGLSFPRETHLLKAVHSVHENPHRICRLFLVYITLDNSRSAMSRKGAEESNADGQRPSRAKLWRKASWVEHGGPEKRRHRLDMLQMFKIADGKEKVERVERIRIWVRDGDFLSSIVARYSNILWIQVN